ncbi:MAG: hypothetical protein AAGA16_07810 [Cyanobacteria bacterium P01_E01_bin.35]
MTRLSQLRTYPFGLFLCLEWILLGGALLSDLPEEYLFAGYENAQQSLSLAITLFCNFYGVGWLNGLETANTK